MHREISFASLVRGLCSCLWRTPRGFFCEKLEILIFFERKLEFEWKLLYRRWFWCKIFKKKFARTLQLFLLQKLAEILKILWSNFLFLRGKIFHPSSLRRLMTSIWLHSKNFLKFESFSWVQFHLEPKNLSGKQKKSFLWKNFQAKSWKSSNFCAQTHFSFDQKSKTQTWNEVMLLCKYVIALVTEY